MLKKLSKDTLVYGLGNGFIKLIGVFLLPFYTKVLTPEDYGVLSTISVTVMMIVTTLNAGLDGATMFYFYTIKTDEEKGKLLFTKFVLRLLVVVPALIFSYFSGKISLLLFGTSQYTWLVFISCIAIPFQMLLSEQQQIYRLLHLPWRFNLIVLFKASINIGVGITLVIFLNYGVVGAQLATLFSSALVVLFSYLFFTNKKYTYRFSWYWSKKMFVFGFPLIFTGIALWACRWSDRYFLLHFKDFSEIGIYAVADTFSQPIALLNAALSLSFLPLFWSNYNKEMEIEKTASKKVASDVWSIYTVIAVSAGIFLSIFSTDFIRIVTTKNYLSGAMAVPFLVFSLIIFQSSNLTRIGIFLSKKMYLNTIFVIVAAVVNISLNFYFVPKYGFLGAAFTTFVSYFVLFLLGFITSQKFFKVKFKIIRIGIYFCVSFVIALLMPFLELHFKVGVSIWLKILLFIFGIALPLIIQLVKLSEIKLFIFGKKNPDLN
ncbi:MAG: polysaccharide biosynthesis C-terminal domain-containing protein [Bacteroidetes bacterium]|nr:polysaccharide biosynthesis C-terminal domain-containing protein [Bacteroidota bacterium]